MSSNAPTVPDTIHVVIDHQVSDGVAGQPHMIDLARDVDLRQTVCRYGPTAAWIIDRVMYEGDKTWDSDQLAALVGVNRTMLARTLNRLARFGVCEFVSADTLIVRRWTVAPRPPANLTTEMPA